MPALNIVKLGERGRQLALDEKLILVYSKRKTLAGKDLRTHRILQGTPGQGMDLSKISIGSVDLNHPLHHDFSR